MLLFILFFFLFNYFRIPVNSGDLHDSAHLLLFDIPPALVVENPDDENEEIVSRQFDYLILFFINFFIFFIFFFGYLCTY
jgi:hypothetical protein